MNHKSRNAKWTRSHLSEISRIGAGLFSRGLFLRAPWGLVACKDNVRFLTPSGCWGALCQLQRGGGGVSLKDSGVQLVPYLSRFNSQSTLKRVVVEGSPHHPPPYQFGPRVDESEAPGGKGEGTKGKEGCMSLNVNKRTKCISRPSAPPRFGSGVPAGGRGRRRVGGRRHAPGVDHSAPGSICSHLP